MNVDTGIWSRLTRIVIALLIVAALLGVGVWYLPLIKQNERMRKEILRRDGEIQKEEIKLRKLKMSIAAMDDPKTVERLAREKMGYAKPGETVVRFEAPATNQTAIQR